MNERTDETKLAKYQKLLKQDGKHCCSAAQSCLTLCNPMDCSLLGFPVSGILQARTLEWVAISSSNA